MNEEQKLLVTEHIDLVGIVLRSNYRLVRQQIRGLEYDDLFQEGCIALCQAAELYDRARSASFKAFASLLIRQALVDAFRKTMKKQGHMEIIPHTEEILDASIRGNQQLIYNMSLYQQEDRELRWEMAEIMEIVSRRAAQQKKNDVLRGVGVVHLNEQGYRSVEIAAALGVGAGHVRAWKSKACKQIRQEAMLVG